MPADFRPWLRGPHGRVVVEWGAVVGGVVLLVLFLVDVDGPGRTSGADDDGAVPGAGRGFGVAGRGMAMLGTAAGVDPSPLLDCSSWLASPLPGPVSSGVGFPGPGASSLVTSNPATTRMTPAAAKMIRKRRRPRDDHPSVASGWGGALSVWARISSGR